MTSPALLADARGITCRFGTFVAVDDVSLGVAPGEVVGLLGANGAGKTTVIRMLLGVLAPTAGAVLLFGGAPDRAARRRLGYVAQGLGIYADLTVAENLAFSRAVFGGRGAPATLTDGLADDMERLAGDIGLGGQRQLAFACALGHAPKLLILDEPTSGVDPLSRVRLWERIRAEAERGAGVLVTTHYLEEAEQCDRLLLMESGRIARAGTLAEVIGGATAVTVDAARWDDAFRVLADAGLAVTLTGRTTRVAAGSPEEVSASLARAGITGDLQVVPATLEETMATLSRGSGT
jgi:ABC-2 type transport system ATP-binding protein